MSRGEPTRPNRAASAEIEETAAEWFGRHDGGLTPQDAAALQAWRAADPRHDVAWRRLEAASQRLASLATLRPSTGGPDADLRLREDPVVRLARPRTRRRWATALAMAAAVAFAWIAFEKLWAERERFAETAMTEVGGLRSLTLPDGSVLDLNTDTAVEIAYDAQSRRVHLLRGEAHFTIAKDAGRPFTVRAGGVNVRAVGTAFNVRLRARDVDVLVTEGRVSLADARRDRPLVPLASEVSAAPAVLTAGHRVVVPEAALASAQPAAAIRMEMAPPLEISRRLAWQAKRIEFEPTALREVLAEFNRYNAHQLVMGDDAVGDIVVGGSFAVGDYEMLARLLEASFGVTAEREATRTILRKQR